MSKICVVVSSMVVEMGWDIAQANSDDQGHAGVFKFFLYLKVRHVVSVALQEGRYWTEDDECCIAKRIGWANLFSSSFPRLQHRLAHHNSNQCS